MGALGGYCNVEVGSRLVEANAKSGNGKQGETVGKKIWERSWNWNCLGHWDEQLEGQYEVELKTKMAF